LAPECSGGSLGSVSFLPRCLGGNTLTFHFQGKFRRFCGRQPVLADGKKTKNEASEASIQRQQDPAHHLVAPSCHCCVGVVYVASTDDDMNSKSAGRSTNDANMNKELANSTLTTGEEGF
jgi:hypothetical protein